jgi:predicted RNase H-like HicB family nuclease
MNKTIDYYLALPYSLELIPDVDEGGWVIKVKELRGCMTQADEWDDIPAIVEDAERLWLESALEHGDPIPEPLGVIR